MPDVVLTPSTADDYWATSADSFPDLVVEFDAFGTPVGKSGWRDRRWVEFLAEGERLGIGDKPVRFDDWFFSGPWHQAWELTRQYRERVDAAGRFPSEGLQGQRLTDLVSGDLAVINYYGLGSSVLACDQGILTWASGTESTDPTPVEAIATDVGIALKSTLTEPFFLPSTWAEMLLASDPPDETTLEYVRLPFPACRVFFSEVSMSALVADDVEVELLSGETSGLEDPAVVSVVVFAGPDGTGLAPIYSMTATAQSLDGPGSERTLFTGFGITEESVLEPLVKNVATLLTWGSWTDPPARPERLDGLDGRAYRRALSTSSIQRAERRGALDGVRVVDLNRITSQSGSDTSSGSGRTVSAHMRRGHWRRVRVAIRDETGTPVGPVRGDTAEPGITYTYEGRWIPPTIVNPDGLEPGPGDRVYRVPD